MLYLCCTNLSITLVNPLFIGYSIAIYDNTLLAAALSLRALSSRIRTHLLKCTVVCVGLHSLLLLLSWLVRCA